MKLIILVLEMRYLFIFTLVCLMVLSENVKAEENKTDVIMVSSLIGKGGSYSFGRWKFYNGDPDIFDKGDYHILLKDINGNIISDNPFGLSFQLHMETIGTADSNVSYIVKAIPYTIGVSHIEVIAPDGSIVFEVDPNIKILRDTIESIPDNCFIDDPTGNRGILINSVDEVEKLIKSSNKLDALSMIEDKIINDINKSISSDIKCADGAINGDMLSSLDTMIHTKECIMMMSNLPDKCRITIKDLVINKINKISYYIDNINFLAKSK